MEGVVKMDNNYLVDIQHERLSFFTPAGEVKALNDVSIHLKEGEVLGIVGESGSGKSVTAYSLMGLTAYPGKLIGGELHFNGHEVEKMTEKDFSKMRGKEVSIIFQDPLTSLNPVYTIGNQIMEVIRLHTDADKKKAYARAVELLSLVGINEPEKRMKQYPHELSGGMRQRVMIAIALACEPTCDEIFYHPKHEYTKGLLESIPRLDSTKHEKLIPIEGNPVDLLNPPEGCAFAPRCKNCMKICLRENPPKTDFSETHYAHCFMNQKAEMEGGNTNE